MYPHPLLNFTGKWDEDRKLKNHMSFTPLMVHTENTQSWLYRNLWTQHVLQYKMHYIQPWQWMQNSANPPEHCGMAKGCLPPKGKSPPKKRYKTIVGYKHNDCSQLLWPWKAFIESVAEHWTRLNTTQFKRESFAGTYEKYDWMGETNAYTCCRTLHNHFDDHSNMFKHWIFKYFVLYHRDAY